MNTETVDRILEHKIIVVMRDLPEDRLIKAAEAMYEGGIRIMEVPFSSSGKRSDKQTAKSIYALRLHFEKRISVGAGTVLTEKQV